MSNKSHKSTFDLLNIPKQFSLFLLTLSLIIAVSPYIGGADFGFIKVPQLFLQANSLMKILCFAPLLITIIFYLPLWRQNGKLRENIGVRSFSDIFVYTRFGQMEGQ